MDPRHYFDDPVRPDEAPDYFEKIERPMSFSEMRQRLADDRYQTVDELAADLDLVVQNAMAYNAPDTKFYRAAQRVQEVAQRTIPMVGCLCIVGRFWVGGRLPGALTKHTPRARPPASVCVRVSACVCLGGG